MATCCAELIEGQELEPLATLKVASGGLAPREVIEVAVKPTGAPAASVVVIIDTPDAWRLKVALSASVGSVSVEKCSMI
jgi:hypothetical protein